MKHTLISIAIIFCLKLIAQNNTLDSLNKELKNAIHDTTRCNILSELAETASDEEWPLFNEQLKKLAEKKLAEKTTLKTFYKIHLADALNNIGFLAQQQGDIPLAMEYFQKSLKLREEIGDKQGMSNSYNNIGAIHDNQGDIPLALEYYKKSLKIIEEIGDKNGMAHSLNNIGYIYKYQGDIPLALEYYKKSLKIREEIGDKQGMTNSYNNIGLIYDNQGDIPLALEYYKKSLKIREEIGDKQGIAYSLNNIGYIHKYQGDIPLALKYYKKSLKIREEIGDKQGIAESYNNIGAIHDNQGDILIALEYFQKTLKIQEEIGDKNGMAHSLNNIGSIHKNQGNIPLALEYCKKSLELREEIGYKQGMAESYNNIGDIYFKQKKYSKALTYANKSLQLSKELGYPDNIMNAAGTLKKIYTKQHNFKEAFAMYELEIQMRDSINNETTKKASIQKQFQYEYEKKSATDSVVNAKANEIKNAQLAKQKAEIKAKRNQQYGLYGGLVLVLLFAGFVYNRLKVTQKQKVIIEQKERETHAQKEIIEEKHKEITDSINYAERIQRSFLATQEMLDKYLGVTSSSPKNEGVSRSERGYFVFFRPKDVVSGDFYWAAELNNGNFAFSVADSTGHGVPGAIMSILNISSLEKSVEKDTEPHQILNTTRRIIIDRLKKDGSKEGGKDGMDCSLLVINKERTQLSFASANNPVFILRPTVNVSEESVGTSSSPNNECVSKSNNAYELFEYKPDKMPVGKHDYENESFTLHNTPIKKGDVIYALTDGFPDQFGGKKGKKYMIKNLKELLLSIAHLPMPEQEQKLADEFSAWKGKNEQVDDVCIIGVRV